MSLKFNYRTNTIESTAGTDLTITPLAGQQLILDSVITVDAGSMTGITTLGFDGVSLTAIQTSGEGFADNDTSIMTSAAIDDRILSYGYTTNTGTVTSIGITAGTLIDVTGSPVTGSGSITVDVDLSEATEAVYAPATDYVLFLDGGVTGTAAKESGADFAAALAGTGLTASGGVINRDTIALTTDTSGDYVATITGGTGIDSTGATSGEGTTHTLSVDLGEVGAVVFDPANDFIPIIDGSATGTTQKDAWADIATAIAGTGITATAGVLSADNNGTVTGTGSNNRIATWSGTSSLDSSSNLTYDGTTVTILSGNVPSSPALELTNARPVLVFDETDATADNGRWYMHASAETFELVAINDANSASEPVFTVNRTGTTIDTVAFNGTLTADNVSGTNTGDQTITLTSDVTGSGTGSFATTIANDAVTFAKMQNSTAASRLVGRGSAAGAGDFQEITVGSGLSMSGTTLSATGGSGTVTSVAAGNGMNFTTITSSGSVTMGTPGTTTASSTNAVTASSHTHAVDNTIRQGLTDSAAITTAGWYRIATNSAAAGRGGATIYITNSGGGDAPDPTMIRIAKGYGSTLNDATITIVSGIKQGASSLDGIRIIFDQVTNNEIYVEVNIGSGSSSTWTHYIVPDNTLGTWASVDYTTGATSDYDLTWDLSTDSVQSGTLMGNGAAQWFDANGVFRIDGRNATSANSGLVVDARGDAYLQLLADRTSDTELENAYVLFSQDAAGVQGVVGTVGNANADSQNNTFTGSTQNGFAIHHKFSGGAVDIGVNGQVGLTVDDNNNVTVKNSGSLFLPAKTAAAADVSGYGQLWVNSTPNPDEIYFTDSNGNDINIQSELWNNGAKKIDTRLTGVTIYHDLYVGESPSSGSIKIAEASAADVDEAGYGQIWVDDSAPNRLYFTDDTGVDKPVGFNALPIYEIDANDTFDLEHAGYMWHKDANAAVTFTCSSTATDVPQGSCWVVHNDDTEDLTIAGSGATVYWLDGTGAPTAGSVTVEQGGIVTVYKYSDTEYWVWGAKTSIGGLLNVVEDTTPQLGGTLSLNGNIITGTVNSSAEYIEAASIGVDNTTGSSGRGLSLYNGRTSGEPTYGVFFGQTATFGTHTEVTGDWATYFTMNTTANRGWIFRKAATGNVAGIDIAGNMAIDGNFYPGGQSTGYLGAVTGQYGSVQCNGADGSSGSYTGFSVEGELVLMLSGTTGGIYDDVNNHWKLRTDTTSNATNGKVSSCLAYDHQNTARAVGFNHVKEIAMTTASITLNDEHCGCVIRRTGSSAVDVILQASTTLFPTGSMVTVLNHGTNTLTISDGSEAMYLMTGAGSVTDSTGFELAIGGCITIWRQGASAYYVWGTGIP